MIYHQGEIVYNTVCNASPEVFNTPLTLTTSAMLTPSVEIQDIMDNLLNAAY